jgi:hypothetical protein
MYPILLGNDKAAQTTELDRPFKSSSTSFKKERHGSGGAGAELSSVSIRELIGREAGKQVPVPCEPSSVSGKYSEA